MCVTLDSYKSVENLLIIYDDKIDGRSNLVIIFIVWFTVLIFFGVSDEFDTKTCTFPVR